MKQAGRPGATVAAVVIADFTVYRLQTLSFFR
jgi:hypothetical protein